MRAPRRWKFPLNLAIACGLALPGISGAQSDGDIWALVRNGHRAPVGALLESNPLLANAKDRWGRTPLYYAARYRQFTLVELLLATGADVNARTAEGFTPLHEAAWYGRRAIARLLVEKGADVNARSRRGSTPLHAAAWYGDAEVAKLLLDSGADANVRAAKVQTFGGLLSFKGPHSPLSFYRNRFPEGETPLHVAARRGNVGVAVLLIDRGADVNARNEFGRTPLRLALDNLHDAIASVLRGRGGIDLAP